MSDDSVFDKLRILFSDLEIYEKQLERVFSNGYDETNDNTMDSINRLQSSYEATKEEIDRLISSIED